MNNSLQEWLTPASIVYVTECLQLCQNAEMLADLRLFVPPQALQESAKRLSAKKRQQIKDWVQQLNSAREVRA